MKYYSVDRFENEYALLQDDEKNIVEILIKDIPYCAKEGDIISIDKNGNMQFQPQLTQQIRQRAFELQNSLWKPEE